MPTVAEAARITTPDRAVGRDCGGVVRLRRLDARSILPLVKDGTDLRAVLGRGRWLPTMTRHVPDPGTRPVDLSALLRVMPAAPVRRRSTRRAVAAPGQSSLFDTSG